MFFSAIFTRFFFPFFLFSEMRPTTTTSSKPEAMKVGGVGVYICIK
jgi:hypothetical protein